MPGAQAIRGAAEVSRKILDCADVGTCGMLSVIKTLEFFQHHFAKSGHGDLLMTRQLISTNNQPLLRSPHAKRPPHGRLRPNAEKLNREKAHVRFGTTNQASGIDSCSLRRS